MKTVAEFMAKVLVAAVTVCMFMAYMTSTWVIDVYKHCPMNQFVYIIIVGITTAIIITMVLFYLISKGFKEEPPPAPVCRFIYHDDEREDFLMSDKYKIFEAQAMAHKALSVTSIPISHLSEYSEWTNSQYLYSFTPMALSYLSNSLVSFERFQEGKITKQNVIMKGI